MARCIRLQFPVVFFVATMLAACGGGSTTVTPAPNNPAPSPVPTTAASPTPAPTAMPTIAPTPVPTQTPAPVPTPTAAPQVIHIGFELVENTDPTFGPVYFYSTMLNNMAQVIRVMHGSKVVFVNDDPSTIPHTASGFGSSGFPSSFDNSSGFNQSGTTIDSSTTWSTGTLNAGQSSQVFTVGPPGTYYFGCNFHYTTKPTASNDSMADVLVSM